MPYSEERLEEIERDPERLRAYYWHVAMNARRMAVRNRARAREQGEACSPVGFRPVFAEGADLLHWAETLERFADAILENLDAFVKSTTRTQRTAERD